MRKKYSAFLNQRKLSLQFSNTSFSMLSWSPTYPCAPSFLSSKVSHFYPLKSQLPTRTILWNRKKYNSSQAPWTSSLYRVSATQDHSPWPVEAGCSYSFRPGMRKEKATCIFLKILSASKDGKRMIDGIYLVSRAPETPYLHLHLPLHHQRHHLSLFRASESVFSTAQHF